MQRRVLKILLQITVVYLLLVPIHVLCDTYRLVMPLHQELSNALNPCDIACLTVIDVGTTYGSEMYEVEGALATPNCKNRCFKYNIPVKDGQMSPLVSMLNFKEFVCKVFGKEIAVTVPWNPKKLPQSYIDTSQNPNREVQKNINVVNSTQMNTIPNDNAKNNVPGILLRLDCLKPDGNQVYYNIIYGQFETPDGKVNMKRSSSVSRSYRISYPNILFTFLFMIFYS